MRTLKLFLVAAVALFAFAVFAFTDGPQRFRGTVVFDKPVTFSSTWTVPLAATPDSFDGGVFVLGALTVNRDAGVGGNFTANGNVLIGGALGTAGASSASSYLASSSVTKGTVSTADAGTGLATATATVLSGAACTCSFASAATTPQLVSCAVSSTTLTAKTLTAGTVAYTCL